MLKKATIRKEQEPDFEEKRFNVTIGEDEREFDKENEFFRERSYRIIREYALTCIFCTDYLFEMSPFYVTTSNVQEGCSEMGTRVYSLDRRYFVNSLGIKIDLRLVLEVTVTPDLS